MIETTHQSQPWSWCRSAMNGLLCAGGGLLLVGMLLAGCASMAQNHAHHPDATVPMVLVYLVTGPASATHTSEQKREIFRGHMANMQRLAQERKLLIAGPFRQPRDKAWRGLFLLDVPTTTEAIALSRTDPGVIAGEFDIVARPVRIDPGVRRAWALEDALQERLKAQGERARDEGEPPPAIRAYVIAHIDDFDRWTTNMTAELRPRVVWSARFTDGGPAGVRSGGVAVLDAASVDEARALLAAAVPADGHTGAPALDGWFSTAALEGLREGASAPQAPPRGNEAR